MTFRIGRKFAQHVYPEPRRGGGSNTSAFARNFAIGPTAGQPVTTTPTPVDWDTIDGGPASGVDVQVTPAVTGIVLITGVLTFKNTSADTPENVVVAVFVNGVETDAPIDEESTAAVNSDGFVTLPIVAECSGLTLGVAVDVQVKISTGLHDDVVSLVGMSSTLNVQEVSAATG